METSSIANFARTMARLPDEELLRIAFPGVGDEYQPEAIAAAQAEIKTRDITEDKISDIENHIKQIDEEKIAAAKEPLGFTGAFLSITFAPFTVINLIAIISLFAKGYKEEAFNVAAYIAMGLFGYIVLATMLVILV